MFHLLNSFRFGVIELCIFESIDRLIIILRNLSLKLFPKGSGWIDPMLIPETLFKLKYWEIKLLIQLTHFVTKHVLLYVQQP